MAMRDDEKVEAIRRVHQQAALAREDHVRKKAALAASEAGHDEWDRMHPDDGVGGMSCNPYDPERAKEDAARAEAAMREWDDVEELFVSRVMRLVLVPREKA